MGGAWAARGRQDAALSPLGRDYEFGEGLARLEHSGLLSGQSQGSLIAALRSLSSSYGSVTAKQPRGLVCLCPR